MEKLIDHFAGRGQIAQSPDMITLPSPRENLAEIPRLSHDFDMCVYGLGEVRREWEQHGGDSVIWVV